MFWSTYPLGIIKDVLKRGHYANCTYKVLKAIFHLLYACRLNSVNLGKRTFTNDWTRYPAPDCQPSLHRLTMCHTGSNITIRSWQFVKLSWGWPREPQGNLWYLSGGMFVGLSVNWLLTGTAARFSSILHIFGIYKKPHTGWSFAWHWHRWIIALHNVLCCL